MTTAKKTLHLYRVRFDGSDTFAEAGTMGAAIKVWHAYATAELDVDEDAEPEEVALLASDDPVLRDDTGPRYACTLLLREIADVCTRERDPATGIQETPTDALPIIARIVDAALEAIGRA